MKPTRAEIEALENQIRNGKVVKIRPMTGSRVKPRFQQKTNQASAGIADDLIKITVWREGSVDRSQEHFELRYGSAEAEDDGWDDWTPIALIGRPVAGIATVQFLVPTDDPNTVEAVRYAKKEIQFYLIDLEKTDPWEYAKYHCGTLANVYSDIHWSFFESGTVSPSV